MAAYLTVSNINVGVYLFFHFPKTFLNIWIQCRHIWNWILTDRRTFSRNIGAWSDRLWSQRCQGEFQLLQHQIKSHYRICECIYSTLYSPPLTNIIATIRKRLAVWRNCYPSHNVWGWMGLSRIKHQIKQPNIVWWVSPLSSYGFLRIDFLFRFALKEPFSYLCTNRWTSICRQKLYAYRCVHVGINNRFIQPRDCPTKR